MHRTANTLITKKLNDFNSEKSDPDDTVHSLMFVLVK